MINQKFVKSLIQRLSRDGGRGHSGFNELDRYSSTAL